MPKPPRTRHRPKRSALPQYNQKKENERYKIGCAPLRAHGPPVSITRPSRQTQIGWYMEFRQNTQPESHGQRQTLYPEQGHLADCNNSRYYCPYGAYMGDSKTTLQKSRAWERIRSIISEATYDHISEIALHNGVEKGRAHEWPR